MIGTAIVTGTAGITGGWVAARTQLRAQARLWRNQHAEDKRDARGAAYHEFLDADRAFQALTLTTQIIDRDTYVEWQNRFDHAYVGVQLFGTELARYRILEFASIFPGQMRTRSRTRGMDDATYARAYSESVRSSYAALFPLIRKAREGVIEAMRLDVAPEEVPRTLNPMFSDAERRAAPSPEPSDTGSSSQDFE